MCTSLHEHVFAKLSSGMPRCVDGYGGQRSCRGCTHVPGQEWSLSMSREDPQASARSVQTQ
jgi:hypothetical protein